MKMKHLLGLVLMVAPLAAAAAECRVVDPELQGRYEGGCRNGLAHGDGIATGAAEYRGEFRNGLKHGQGVKTWAWGDRYAGGFRDDRRHGKGVYTWGAQSPWAGERYEGDYVADMREGWGTYHWPNGDRFEGVWKQDGRYGYSAMEIRRQAAEKAAAEALTPGTRVCSRGKVGIALDVLRVGQIEAVKGQTLEVRLLQVEGDAAAIGGEQAGALLTGPAGEWGACL